MKLADVLDIADRHYPDGMIRLHWNERRECPHSRSQGDMLALFIVNEIFETYDPDRTDSAQLAKAARVLKRALAELASVHGALESASVEKIAADWCARTDETTA